MARGPAGRDLPFNVLRQFIKGNCIDVNTGFFETENCVDVNTGCFAIENFVDVNTGCLCNYLHSAFFYNKKLI